MKPAIVYVREIFNLDADSSVLLHQIAEAEAQRDGEKPNKSLTVRRLIRAKAHDLGYSASAPEQRKQTNEKARNVR